MNSQLENFLFVNKAQASRPRSYSFYNLFKKTWNYSSEFYVFKKKISGYEDQWFWVIKKSFHGRLSKTEDCYVTDFERDGDIIYD